MNEITAKPSQFLGQLARTSRRLFNRLSLDSLFDWIILQVITDEKSREVCRNRKNISKITQLAEDDPKIELYLKGLYQNLLYNYLEFFKASIEGPEKIADCVEFDHTMIQQIYQILGSGTGVVLAGVHTFGYDICMRAMNDYLPNIQIIGKAKPVKGEILMHRLRKINRVNVTPLSVSSLRNAVARLMSGGIVAIAIDIPVKCSDKFVFFDWNALLTNAHTRLAVQTGAKIFLFYSHRIGKCKYKIEIQEVQPPENCWQKKDLIFSWAQKSYQQVEPFILRWPEAWYGSTFELFPQE